MIYNANAIESIESQLGQVTCQRSAFRTPASVKKVRYLAIDRISERWKQPLQDWVAALHHF